MRNDESVFKVPCSKRKTRKDSRPSNSKKMTERKGTRNQLILILTVNESPLTHPFRMEATKGKRDAVVDHCFHISPCLRPLLGG